MLARYRQIKHPARNAELSALIYIANFIFDALQIRIQSDKKKTLKEEDIMDKRVIWILSIMFIIIVSVIAISVVGSPKPSNALVISEGLRYDWELLNEQSIYGQISWSEFGGYRENDPIKIYYKSYVGPIWFSSNEMTWEDEYGRFSSKPLILSDLETRWKDTESVFKFRYDDDFYKVSFSIPLLNNGTYKYLDLEESWENGELYVTINSW